MRLNSTESFVHAGNSANANGRRNYVERVNRAIDYIVRNLDQPLRLEEIAHVASFSSFHFHRVFQTSMGETLGQFVKRLRLERALFMIAHDRTRSLTQIALACGFSSSSDFSRSFKQRYGVPPSAFDLNTWRSSKRNELQATVCEPDERYRLARLPPGNNPDGFAAEIRDLPARTVAYIRVLDPYRGTAVADAAARLINWAEDHGVADRQWLGYQWEDPEIVALTNCRYDVAVEVDRVQPKGESEGEIGRFEFPSMRVAEVQIRGSIDLVQRALDWLFGTWLPSSGYVPDDLPCFEAWSGRPFAHGFEYFEIHAQLPVKKARQI